jgi:hypothetical protein
MLGRIGASLRRAFTLDSLVAGLVGWAILSFIPILVGRMLDLPLVSLFSFVPFIAFFVITLGMQNAMANLRFGVVEFRAGIPISKVSHLAPAFQVATESSSSSIPLVENRPKRKCHARFIFSGRLSPCVKLRASTICRVSSYTGACDVMSA